MVGSTSQLESFWNPISLFSFWGLRATHLSSARKKTWKKHSPITSSQSRHTSFHKISAACVCIRSEAASSGCASEFQSKSLFSKSSSPYTGKEASGKWCLHASASICRMQSATDSKYLRRQSSNSGVPGDGGDNAPLSSANCTGVLRNHVSNGQQRILLAMLSSKSNKTLPSCKWMALTPGISIAAEFARICAQQRWKLRGKTWTPRKKKQRHVFRYMSWRPQTFWNASTITTCKQHLFFSQDFYFPIDNGHGLSRPN